MEVINEKFGSFQKLIRRFFSARQNGEQRDLSRCTSDSRPGSFVTHTHSRVLALTLGQQTQQDFYIISWWLTFAYPPSLSVLPLRSLPWSREMFCIHPPLRLSKSRILEKGTFSKVKSRKALGILKFYRTCNPKPHSRVILECQSLMPNATTMARNPCTSLVSVWNEGVFYPLEVMLTPLDVATLPE